MKLMKFVLNNDQLDGTVIEQYIDLAVKEKAPEIYKPREGKVLGNLEKFSRLHLEFMYNFGKELIDNFGYSETFTGVPNPIGSSFIDSFNLESYKKSLFV